MPLSTNTFPGVTVELVRDRQKEFFVIFVFYLYIFSSIALVEGEVPRSTATARLWRDRVVPCSFIGFSLSADDTLQLKYHLHS